jgi:thiamine transport system substrate-binding protein
MRGIYIQIEVGAAIKDSPEIDLARQFLAFMMSAQAQAVMPVNHWMMPVREPSEPLPAAFQRLEEPTQPCFPWMRRPLPSNGPVGSMSGSTR